ncbi:hypothetical protein Avbf_15179 [Armadillidium vulgare]|nr:hypothetical protein Avbf_15179 [Armadillidium vulgare]
MQNSLNVHMKIEFVLKLTTEMCNAIYSDTLNPLYTSPTILSITMPSCICMNLVKNTINFTVT